MQVGYSRLLSPEETGHTMRQQLLGEGAETVSIDPYTATNVSLQSGLMSLIDHCSPGDRVIIPSLERVSESPKTWQRLLNELEGRQLELTVLISPSLGLSQWREILTWWHPMLSERSNSRIITVGKESKEERLTIRPLSRDKEGRDQYWQIVKTIQQKASLRRTARRQGVSQGTVLRIKRDVTKLRQTLWLVGTFLITIVSLNIAQAYSDHWLTQFAICGLATVLIIYFTYSDMRED